MRDLDIIDSIAYALDEQSNGMSKTAGIKDKILAMFGAQRKPSAAKTVGKNALLFGAGAGLGGAALAKYPKEIADYLNLSKLKSLIYAPQINATGKAVAKAMKEKFPTSNIEDGIPDVKQQITEMLKQKASFAPGIG